MNSRRDFPPKNTNQCAKSKMHNPQYDGFLFVVTCYYAFDIVSIDLQLILSQKTFTRFFARSAKKCATKCLIRKRAGGGRRFLTMLKRFLCRNGIARHP